MHTFTAVMPTQPQLPPDLGLLLAPVCANEASAPDEYVGRTDGMLFDEEGHGVAFILRLGSKLDTHGARTLVPAAAMTLTDGPILHLAWTEDQLRAQPRLDEELQPHSRVDGGPPVESQWMPARPNVVPPAGGLNGGEAVKEGLAGGAVGAALGAAAGLAVGGPIAAASLAVFMAAGGSLAGVLSGVTQETAPEAGEMKFQPLEKDPSALGVALHRLEERLRDRDLEATGYVSTVQLTPMTTTQATSPPVPAS
jgi:hypothetical protein